MNGYLSGPVDFRWKNLKREYWGDPDHNFFMSASIQLKKEPGGYTAKLFMSFGLDNGRLQKEYLSGVLAALLKQGGSRQSV